jgi:serine/threonine-protein phosphatase PGAM5
MTACARTLDRVFEARFKPAQGAARRELWVCHGNVIRYLTTKALHVDPRAWLMMSVGHTSLTTVRIAADGSMQVIAVGDVGHLPPSLHTGTIADAERTLTVP